MRKLFVALFTLVHVSICAESYQCKELDGLVPEVFLTTNTEGFVTEFQLKVYEAIMNVKVDAVSQKITDVDGYLKFFTSHSDREVLKYFTDMLEDGKVAFVITSALFIEDKLGNRIFNMTCED